MTIYKVGCKLDDIATNIEYVNADDEESAAMIYDKIYLHLETYNEFYIKKLGLFRTTIHVVRMPLLSGGFEYKILRKSWRPLTWASG